MEIQHHHYILIFNKNHSNFNISNKKEMQQETSPIMDDYNKSNNKFQFKIKRSIQLTGPTHAGKTTWLFNLLKNKDIMFNGDEIPQQILYNYGVYQPTYDKMKNEIPNITFHEGIPSLEELQMYSDGKSTIVIFDDLAHMFIKNPEMEVLMVRECHHNKITCIVINHNIFQKGNHSRTQALNTQYMICFKNCRDQQQFAYLAREIDPINPKRITEAYRDAISKPYGYLVIDFTENTDDNMRLLTDIFPDEDTMVYFPNKYNT